MEIVEVKCPSCGCKDKETKSFGRQDFRYECTNCGTNYLVHYESLPVSIRQLTYNGKHNPVDLGSKKNADKFAREYECCWRNKD